MKEYMNPPLKRKDDPPTLSLSLSLSNQASALNKSQLSRKFNEQRWKLRNILHLTRRSVYNEDITKALFLKLTINKGFTEKKRRRKRRRRRRRRKKRSRGEGGEAECQIIRLWDDGLKVEEELKEGKRGRRRRRRRLGCVGEGVWPWTRLYCSFMGGDDGVVNRNEEAETRGRKKRRWEDEGRGGKARWREEWES